MFTMTTSPKNNWLVFACCALAGAGLAFASAQPSGSAKKPYSRDAAKAAYARPASVPCPEDNAITPARIQLGKALFFDPRLSGSNAISCASCHNPAFSWGDGLPKGVGHGSKQVGRRTPTILNTAYAELLFWDGRASSLEEQALGPIAAAGEMNLPHDEMVKKLAALTGYLPLVEAAYPGQAFSPDIVAKAIATYERTIISGTAPFDEWIQGKENAISDSAKRGFDLFNTKANCFQCHSGWNFTDNGFHDIGVPGNDLGRGKILTDIDSVQFAFKTPTLRNVDHRAPYMHDGTEKTLEEVMNFYNIGGKTKRASLAHEIQPLGLNSTEIDDLCNFLHSLTSKDKPVEIPVLPNP